jgi:hypothetical protein
VNGIWHVFLVYNDNVLHPEFMWHWIRADEWSLATCALLLKSYYLCCQQYFNGQRGNNIRLADFNFLLCPWDWHITSTWWGNSKLRGLTLIHLWSNSNTNIIGYSSLIVHISELLLWYLPSFKTVVNCSERGWCDRDIAYALNLLQIMVRITINTIIN